MWWHKSQIIKLWFHQSNKASMQEGLRHRFKSMKLNLVSLMMLFWRWIKFKENGYTCNLSSWEEPFLLNKADGEGLMKSTGTLWTMLLMIPKLWHYPILQASSKHSTISLYSWKGVRKHSMTFWRRKEISSLDFTFWETMICFKY